MNFNKILARAVNASGSLLCIGLDPVFERIPESNRANKEEAVEFFCKQVVDATAEFCCAYKINIAFFEALGAAGITVFERVLSHIPSSKIIIADAKRGDIATSAQQYSTAFFNTFNVDAVTLNPLMGFETLEPFLNNEKKAVYVLALTSNPGAKDFLLHPFDNYPLMGSYIAARLNTRAATSETHIGLVVGATQHQQLQQVISEYPSGGLLIPGIGTQGGRIDNLVTVLKHHEGIPVITVSRSIIYAGENAVNWQHCVSKKASELKQQIAPLTARYV